MHTPLVSRRRLTLALAALPAIGGLRGSALRAANAAADDAAAGLSHDAEAIHQEVTFAASPLAVYEVLTSTARFDAVTRLSDAVTLLSAPGAQATRICFPSRAAHSCCSAATSPGDTWRWCGASASCRPGVPAAGAPDTTRS